MKSGLKTELKIIKPKIINQMKKYLIFTAYILFSSVNLFAQDNGSLLDELGSDNTTDYITSTFKSPKVINSHSVEMLQKGVLDFRILHRFGLISNGAYEMFGLDQATMRLSFDYGITNNLSIGIGRSTRNKEFDGMIKYRLLQQSKGAINKAVSLVWVSGMTINGLKDPFAGEIETTFNRRLAYYHQLIVGRKFNEKFSLQLSPMIVHRNITTTSVDPNTLFGMEVGARYKLTNRFALVLDYTHAFNRFPGKISYNPLSVGVDIETGGHVFQLHFSNAVGMNERSFVADNNGSWLDGKFMFGFNLSRVFQVNN